LAVHDLAVRNGTDLDVRTLGSLLAQSGYFKDAREMAQAAVKVLAGREMGVGPVAAMTGIHIIEGKPTVSAGLMASAVKGSGKYDYRIRTHTETECSIEFFQGSESIGTSAFTMKDAQAAQLNGKAVWKNYPRNMLFARALSNGVRWYCPDVFQVGAVYTPEELGADVDRDGNPNNLAPTPLVRVIEPEQQDQPKAEPITGEVVQESPHSRLLRLAKASTGVLTTEQRDALKARAVELSLPPSPSKAQTDDEVIGWIALIEEATEAAKPF
jgi:hypothetical protein